MNRTALALLLAFAASPTPAQTPGPVTPQVVAARVENGALVWTTTQVLPVTKTVAVAVVVNGKDVIETRTVTELTRVSNERSEVVKNLRVTDGTGTVIPSDRLADRLKDETVVVIHVGRLPEAYRRLFKDDVVLVELPGPRATPPRP